MAKWDWELEYAEDGVLDSNDFNVYQIQAKSTAIYPKDKALEYLALKLCGESGEVAEKIGKCIRDKKPIDDQDLIKELGDVMWYVANLADHLGYDLSEVAERNIAKLKDRQQRGVLGGSGDSR